MKKIFNTIITILMILVLAGCSTPDRYEITPEVEIESKTFIDYLVPLDPPTKKIVGGYISAGTYVICIMQGQNRNWIRELVNAWPIIKQDFIDAWEAAKRNEIKDVKLINLSWSEIKEQLKWSNLKLSANRAVSAVVEEIIIRTIGQFDIISPGIGGLGDKTGILYDLGRREAERRRRSSEIEIFDVN